MTTLTPTAVDDHVYIESIHVRDRHRKDLGDLQPLMDSIAELALLNPITLTRDSRLIAGQRRLEACRRLGWEVVPVRFVDDLDDATSLLYAERDENTCRLPMKPSELVAIGRALERLERPAADARMKAGKPVDPEISGSQGSEGRKTYTKVAKALGWSGASYKRARKVVEVAEQEDQPETVRALASEALAEMDATGEVLPAYAKVMTAVGRERARREAQEVKTAALAEPERVEPTTDESDLSWIPGGRDSSPNAVQQRRKLIAHHADRGLSSRQIAEIVGISDEGVRKAAKAFDVAIPADAIVGRQRRIDSNRVVRETVYSLEGSAMAVQLVNVAELDRAEIGGWTASLTESIRALNRLVKQLKELAS